MLTMMHTLGLTDPSLCVVGSWSLVKRACPVCQTVIPTVTPG
jgi:hypothetical protein